MENTDILKKILEAAAENLDLNQVLYIICKEISDKFHVDRVAFAQFKLPENYSQLFTLVEYTKNEYIIPHKKVIVPVKVNEYLGKTLLDEGKDIIIDNFDDKRIPDFYRKFHNKLGTKSIINIPIKKDDYKWGIMAIFQNSCYRHWTDEEIELLHTIVDFIYFAIRQAELNSALQKKAEIECLSRRIIEKIRSSLNIDETLTYICDEVGKLLNVQRAAISQFPDNKHPEYFINRREYKNSDELKGLIEVAAIDKKYTRAIGEFWGEYVVDQAQIVPIDNIYKADIPKSFREAYSFMGVKSLIGVPVKSGNEVWGGIFLAEYDYYRKWTEDEINLLKSITDQIYIAIKQAELYEITKKQAERETLLRKIIDKIRSSLDIEETLTYICDEVGKLFNVQRVTLSQFPYPNYIVAIGEYKESKEIKGLSDIKITHEDYINEMKPFWEEHLIKKGEVVTFDNVYEADIPESFREAYSFMGVKSLIGIPVQSGENKWGGLFLAEHNYYRKWTEDEISLLKSITDQIYIAINQAELYTITKKQAERETLSRKIIEKIRSSLDIEETFAYICDESAKVFNVQRTFITEFLDPENPENFITRKEYKKSKEIKGFTDIIDININYKKAIGEFWFKNLITKGEILTIDNISEADIPELFKQAHEAMGIKSIIGVPVIYGENKWGGLYLAEYDYYRKWTEDEINLLKSITDQIYIAIKQAELYTITKKQAERETISRKIIEKIRSSLDIDDTLTYICDEAGKLFNVQRAAITEFSDPKNIESFLVRREYKQTQDIKGFLDIADTNKEYAMAISEFWGEYVVNQAQIVPIDNIYKADLPESFREAYSFMGVKSIIGVPIKSGESKWGGLYLAEYDYYRKWTEDEISLLESITDQIYVALKQAELFEKANQTAKRESLLRKIIETIRNTLDINDTKKTIVNELGKLINADIFIIRLFDSDKDDFLPVDEHSEYKSSPDITGIREIEIQLGNKPEIISHEYLKNLFKKNKSLYIQDTEDLLAKDKNIAEPLKILINTYKMKSVYTVPIFYSNKLLGAFEIIYTKEPVNLSKENIIMIETLAAQAGIALNQAMIYKKEKQATEREKVLRSIILRAISTFEISQIKQIVKDIGTLTKADRCYFVEVDVDNMTGKPVDSNSEYLSSSEIKSIVDYKFPVSDVEAFVELYLNIKDLYVFDYEKIRSENNAEYAGIKNYSNIFKLKSGIGIPFYYLDKLRGVLAIEYVQEKILPSQDELNFLRTVGNQVGVALNQALLYQDTKKIGERERITSLIINKIRSKLDVNYVKHEIVDQLGTLLQADRVAVGDYDAKTNNYYVDNECEYRSSMKIKTFVGVDFAAETGFVESIRDVHIKGHDIIFSDLEQYLDEKNLRGSGIEKFYRNFGYVSSAAINMYYGDIFLGDLVITFKNKRNFADDEIEFLKTIADQAGIAIYQARLYQQAQKTAERESLLRNIIEKLRSSLDIKTIKQQITTQLGQAFNADRCYFRSYDKTTDKFLPADSEYRSSDNITSLMDIEPDQQSLKFFFEKIIKNKKGSNLVVADEEIAKNIELERYFKSAKIKADYAISIFDREDKLTYLVLHYSEKDPKFDDEDKKFLETVADQITIAFDQHILFEKIKQTAERERILREIISKIKSSQDIEYIKHEIVNQLGKLLNADRALFADYDYKTKSYSVFVKEEYKSSDNIKEIAGYYSPLRAKFLEAVKEVHLEGKDNIFNDLDKFLDENNFRGTVIEDYYRKFEYGSLAAICINYGSQFLGNLVIAFRRKNAMSDDDIKFIRTIADQAGVAIHQAQLFNTVVQTAEKERTLREVVSELKAFLTIDDAFNFLLTKISRIYKSARTILIEIPTEESEKPRIGYEHINKKNIFPLKGSVIPDACTQMFIEIADTLAPVIVNDTEQVQAEDKIAQDFFTSYSIKSFVACPLVRYNHVTKLYGILVICDNHPRIWSEYEISLLQSLNESVVNVLWEILKVIEINKLRDSFINTLAHDLQVPVIGDIKALEFLKSRPLEKQLGEFQDIIDETILNDKRILNILKRLLKSYKYESEKQELNLIKTPWAPIVNGMIKSFKELADKKSISINVIIPDNLPEIYVDIKEISIALSIFIENAIMYIQNAGEITVKAELYGNKLKTCIIDNGYGIPPNIMELIFKRYEMTVEIERKIGAGISLYLAKQIIEAHKGSVFFTSEMGKGSTFCFLLPVKKPNGR